MIDYVFEVSSSIMLITYFVISDLMGLKLFLIYILPMAEKQ